MASAAFSPGPQETTPLLQNHHHEASSHHSHFRLSSAKKTFGNVIISIVGSGVLGLPNVFMRAGWLFGSCAIAVVACETYYCMMLLVKCRQKLTRMGHSAIHTYGDLGHHAYGRVGQALVDTMVLLSQGSCCVAYLIFIGENLSTIFAIDTSAKDFFIFLMAPLQVVLAWVRSLTGLAPFSALADVSNLLAMGVVIQQDIESFHSIADVHAWNGWASVPFAIGVAIYCYEGFSMTLPLEASMKNRSRFPGVLGISFFCITILYISFGIIGYVAFGEDTKEIITLNMKNGWSTVAVKIALCVGLFFTFPVMMHPVHEIFERRISTAPCLETQVERSPRLRKILFRGIRASIVIVSAFTAVGVPGFGMFISLVGSTVCAMLAFVLPAVFHLHVMWDDMNRLEMVVDSLLIVLGLIFATYGTWSAIIEIFFSRRKSGTMPLLGMSLWPPSVA